jgi:hypothetical protein
MRWTRPPLLFAAMLLFACETGDARFDLDEDGVEDLADCGPEDADIYPGAPDPWGDGVDTDCDGRDGVDADADGFPANLEPDDPYLDCDDNNPLVNPGAFDLVSDGVDRNCDGHAGIDGDGDGDASIASGGLDCDDVDPEVQPGAADPFGDEIDQDCSGGDGVDADGDGYPAEDPDYDGTPVAWDCNDANALVHPGAPELEGDGIDNDCDGFDAADADQDGHVSDEAGGDDCDDADPASYPGAEEQADGSDNDCDGVVDEGTILVDDDGDGFSEVEGDCDDANGLLSPADGDGDGFSTCQDDCDDADPTQTPGDLDQDGLSSCLGDCDDYNPDVSPLAAEVCNLVDDNCDGVQTDEQDADGDGSPACDDCNDEAPLVEGLDADGDTFTTCQGDCDDTLPQVNPFATDAIGDGIDQNCDGVDGFDADGDGAASTLSGGTDCDDIDPALNQLDADADGSSTCDGDCDDADATVHPAATDVCGDGVDQDCVGGLAVEVDDDGDGAAECAGDCDDTDPVANPADADGDGASTCDGDCDDADVTLNLADADTDGYSTCLGDCADLEPEVNPGAAEVCNLVDDNCDGLLLTEEADADGDGDPLCTDCDDVDPGATTLDADSDGFDTCTGGDCDDSSIAFNPVALDGFGDTWDTNCDGVDGIDGDDDGYASEASGGPDCDDGDPGIHPGAAESSGDGIDQDCDGLDAADVDGDGYVSAVTGGEDCDDGDPEIYPGFFEDPNDGVDSNCDGADGNVYLAFTGAQPDDGAAWKPGTVALCDLDGDGVLDLAAGAPLWEEDGQLKGVVGIWYGPLSGGGVVAGAPTRLVGSYDSSTGGTFHAGYGLACLGDTDGDGQEELAVGTPVADWTLGDRVNGAVFVVQGALAGEVVLDAASASSSYLRVSLSWDATLTPSWENSWSGYLGQHVDAGDFDGDGIGDLLVTVGGYTDATPYFPVSDQSGKMALVLPGPPSDLADLAVDGVALVHAGGQSVSLAGFRPFASAGDTNGDGVDDLLMTLPWVDVDGDGDAEGGVYLFQGPLSGTLGPSAAQAQIVGPDSLGIRVADGVGDLDGDGYDDIAVTTESGSSLYGGGIYVLHGPLNGTVEMEFADAVITNVGPSGCYVQDPTVAGAGDVDGDGFGDLLIAWGSNQDCSSSSSGPQVIGGARIAYGPFGGEIDIFGPQTEPLTDEGTDYDARRTIAGRSGDLDGDGVPDPVVLSVPYTSGAGETGVVRVYLNPYDE